MTLPRWILLATAWLITALMFYASVTNIAAFINLPQLKYSIFDTTHLNGILAFNLIASLFSLAGLTLSTFNSSLLRIKVGLRNVILTGVCMFPIANIVEWLGSGFEVTRYHLSSLAISIFVTALIAGAISTACRNK